MLENVQTVGGRVKGKTKNDLVYATWSFTSTCNFSCSYCPDHLHDGKYGFPKYDDAIWFIKSLSQQLPETAHIVFELVGGEPTMWPKLIEFGTAVQDFFADKKQQIIIQLDTNGSRTNRWFKKIIEKNLHKSIIFNFSYHADMCDPELFYSNLEIVSSKYQTNANFMLDPRHFDKVINLLERVNKNLPVDTVTKMIRPVDKDIDALNTKNIINGYEERMLDYIKNHLKHMFEYNREVYDIPGDKLKWPLTMYFDDEKIDFQKVLLHKQHSFKGWKCSAGSRRFFIEPGGDIYPCSLIRGKSDNMGNIADQNFTLYEDHITCPVQWCPCKMDAIAEKVRQNQMNYTTNTK